MSRLLTCFATFTSLVLNLCCSSVFHLFVSAEGFLIGNSEVDRQLLEASKSGDVDVVKVSHVGGPV